MAYTGNYPNQIKCVYSVGKRICVTTNNGRHYEIKPLTAYGRSKMPAVRMDRWEYQAPHYETIELGTGEATVQAVQEEWIDTGWIDSQKQIALSCPATRLLRTWYERLATVALAQGDVALANSFALKGATL